MKHYPIQRHELYSILETNKFARVSLNWLYETMAQYMRTLSDAALNTEAYLLLDAIITRRLEIDGSYLIFYKFEQTPIVLQNKDVYSFDEYEVISNISGIPLDVFIERIEQRTGPYPDKAAEG